MIIFPKKIELKDETARKLEHVADTVDVEQKVIDAGIGDSKIITLEELCSILKRIKKVRLKINRGMELSNPDTDRYRTVLYFFTRSELVEETLDFFKSIDEEYYKRFLGMLILENKYEDITLNGKFAKNVYGPQYSNYFRNIDACSMRNDFNGKRMVYSGIKNGYSRKDFINTSKVYDINDYVTYSNVFTVIHELSHGLDAYIDVDKKEANQRTINILKGKKNAIPYFFDSLVRFLIYKRNMLGQKDISITDKEQKRITEIARLYLAETTSIFMEFIYADYLKEKKPELGNIIFLKNTNRILNIKRDINEVHLLALLGLFKKSGKIINNEELENIINENGFNKQTVKDVINSGAINMPLRYVLADLLVPSMIEVYNRNPIQGREKFKKYLQFVKDNNLDGALQVFEIDIHSKEGINKIIENYEKNLRKYFPHLYQKEEVER